MRAFFFFLLLCATLVWSRFHYVCHVKNLCDGVAIIDTSRPQTLSLKDGDKIILDNYEQFGFDDKEVNPKLSANNTNFLDKVADYLKANEEKNLKITGFYRENEEGIKFNMFDNLGIARAVKIKEALESRGIDAGRISIDYNKINGNDLLEPITFELLSRSPDEFGSEGTRLTPMAFSFYDMTFTESNFDFDSDVFKPGTAFKTYADSVKIYLALNPDKTLTIIGHTDIIGTDAYNNELGLRRAKSVRKYIRDMGVESKINIGSKGKREPVAPNDTEANRRKNRRVNIRID